MGVVRDVVELLCGVVLFAIVLGIGFVGWLWVRAVAPEYERGRGPEPTPYHDVTQP